MSIAFFFWLERLQRLTEQVVHEYPFSLRLISFLRGSLALHQLRAGLQRGVPRRLVSLRDLVQSTLQLRGGLRCHRLRWVQQSDARDVVLAVRSLLGMPVGALGLDHPLFLPTRPAGQLQPFFLNDLRSFMRK